MIPDFQSAMLPILSKMKDEKNGLNYIVLFGILDNGFKLYIRIPISAIQESVRISNNLLGRIMLISFLVH